MDRLTVGMHVDIKRSDGRVHSAMITEIKREQNSVNVEWFEKCETKGKEIDFTSLLKTNPTLAAIENPLKNVDENIKKEPPQPRRITTFAPSQPQNAVVKTNGSLAANHRRITMIVPKTSNTENIDVSKANATQSVIRIPTTKKLSDVEVIEQPTLPTVTSGTKNDDSPGFSSKSAVVENIEKLQRNREERRAQQNEVKKQREQMKNLDPGNPNWQFLSMIRDYQAQIDYRPLKISDAVTENRICVCVRKRPLGKNEIAKKEIEVITVPNKDHIIVHQPQVKVDLTKYLENIKFRFDYTFDENSNNEMVYKFTAQPLVKTIFQQGFATCFAYGQTGSGKTHTMGGDFNPGSKVQDCSKGIYVLTAIDVFKMLKRPEYRSENLYVGCSFFEIYGGKVFDLLGKRAKLRILEDGKKSVQVIGLQEKSVESAEEVLNLIKQGSDQRTAGQTSANNNSSRSHAVFQIILRKKPNSQLYGKFSLIDLAGNERGVDTISSDRQTRMEGAEINKSLLALKECIRAMGRNSSHVPFRCSKLTLVLRDSFVGQNAKTCMIAMVSPGMNSVENTLNTLRYADRVKELGCEDGTNSPLPDENLMLNPDLNDDDLVVEDNDLSILRSRNTDIMDDGMYKMQLAFDAMNKAEEHAIDGQQSMLELANDLASLIEKTNNVDYDMDLYARESLQVYDKFEAALRQCKDSMKKFVIEMKKVDEQRRN